MTAPLRSFQTQFGRFYAHPSSGVPGLIARTADPNQVQTTGQYAPNPSVTNIIGVMDEGFLPNFYAKLVAEHAVNNFGSIKFAAEKFGPEIAINSLKAVPSRANAAAAIGDEVHDAIDQFVHGTSVAEFSTTTAKQMFAQFKEFMDVEQPEIIASEFTVWSYKYGYAGTGDLMWRWRDDAWIVDTKTGSRVYPKVAMQCAALANADVILDATGNETPMPLIRKLGVFHVRPRSARLYELQNIEPAFEAFLGLKACFDWRRFSKDDTIPAEPLAEVEFRFGAA